MAGEAGTALKASSRSGEQGMDGGSGGDKGEDWGLSSAQNDKSDVSAATTKRSDSESVLSSYNVNLHIYRERGHLHSPSSCCPHPFLIHRHRHRVITNNHRHHRRIMSTDLQLRQDLPAIRLTSLKIKLPDESCIVQLEVEECQTPKSPRHQIPEVTECPPAPKKQRLAAPSCKRRISEFEFYEIVARDEIESFFRSGFEFISQNSSTNMTTCIPL
ncbi:hypothetical protein L1987_75750 [Smallanthus sonchifolius]|uniref:Uncharacterized protein n=1 Tax=Smallanthus sonchifolius TaxID=185202 RepID=A0ACB9A6Y9_9ASTR|nr:hypothetical protein L1987_75750 [Smallanthus sonchifolius]